MPVRRRAKRRRATASLDEWDTYLQSGYDWFDDLCDAGVAVNEDGKPSDEDARAAWEAYAFDLLERWKTTRLGLNAPWAVEHFGEPVRRGLRRCR